MSKLLTAIYTAIATILVPNLIADALAVVLHRKVSSVMQTNSAATEAEVLAEVNAELPALCKEVEALVPASGRWVFNFVNVASMIQPYADDLVGKLFDALKASVPAHPPISTFAPAAEAVTAQDAATGHAEAPVAAADEPAESPAAAGDTEASEQPGTVSVNLGGDFVAT